MIDYEAELDNILSDLKNGQSIEWIRIELSKRIKIDQQLFDELIGKLHRDSLIRINHTVTVEGWMFEGYVKEKEKKIISANLQSMQTWAIAVGTSLAGIYALFQLLEMLCKCFSCHN